nr:hypothetical protein [Pandoravirus aubagnensis]
MLRVELPCLFFFSPCLDGFPAVFALSSLPAASLRQERPTRQAHTHKGSQRPNRLFFSFTSCPELATIFFSFYIGVPSPRAASHGRHHRHLHSLSTQTALWPIA